MEPLQKLHPSFKFNGLEFETSQEIVLFAKQLKENGALHEVAIAKFIVKWFNDKPHIKVKTSGSTGVPKKIKLLKTDMVQSAFATGVYFNLGGTCWYGQGGTRYNTGSTGPQGRVVQIHGTIGRTVREWKGRWDRKQ